jgi:hypothetical protein
MKLTNRSNRGLWSLLLCPLSLSLATIAIAQNAEPTQTTLAALVLSIAADTPAPVEPVWQLAAPKTPGVEFRGLASFDYAGVNAQTALIVGSGNAALAAVTAVSFLINAAVINHARESQKNSVQLEADKILLPYESILTDYRSSDLYAQAWTQTRNIVPRTMSGKAWQVSASPVFSMTQDQKAIVLDTIVEVRNPDLATPAYTSTIRVVGSPQEDGDLTAYWTAQHGQALRSASESLLAEALGIALKFAAQNPIASHASPAKTLRFMQGGIERVERAEVLLQGCSRTVFRTLRGALMAVPTLHPDSACATPPTMTAVSAAYD